MNDSSDSLKQLVDAARRAGTLIETHISWVILGKSRVYKFKKPVDFGFLDFSTLELRKRACEAELLLNSRFAPGVYLEVVAVRQGASGKAYVDDPDFPGEVGPPSTDTPHDPVLDWAVKMRRLDDRFRADILLSERKLGFEQIEQLAELIETFHESCTTDDRIADWGSAEAVTKNVVQNFEQTNDFLQRYLAPKMAQALREHQLGFLKKNAELFARRMHAGRIRDGHGDLRLEHVYFTEEGIQIIDCIEFNEAFRYADVCADLAFLVMDLRHQGRSDLAERLLGRYAERSGDFELYRSVDFYEAYRAFVRGKVLALLENERAQAGHPLPSLHEEARRYFLHAVAVQEPNFEPARIIAVGGLIASGKSTISRRIARGLSFDSANLRSTQTHRLTQYPVLDADSCRKRLAGVAPEQPQHHAAYSGLYTQEMSERVYQRLLEQAEYVLDSGRSVVLDATFRTRAMRASLRDFAERKGVVVHFVWCQAPRDIAFERLAARAREGGISDGRAEIYDEVAAEAEPPDAAELAHLLFLDTHRSPTEQRTQLLEFLSEQ